MAESFVEKRKRELGITGNSGSSDGTSFMERRKIELGMVEGKMSPAQEQLAKNASRADVNLSPVESAKTRSQIATESLNNMKATNEAPKKLIRKLSNEDQNAVSGRIKPVKPKDKPAWKKFMDKSGITKDAGYFLDAADAVLGAPGDLIRQATKLGTVINDTIANSGVVDKLHLPPINPVLASGAKTLFKTDIPGVTTGPAANFIRGLGDAADFGTSRALDEAFGNTQYLAGRDTKAAKAGEIAGIALPVSGGVYKLGKWGARKGSEALGKQLAQTAGTFDNVVRADLPQTVRRVANKGQVPEVFPERFQRTVGRASNVPLVPMKSTIGHSGAEPVKQPVKSAQGATPSDAIQPVEFMTIKPQKPVEHMTDDEVKQLHQYLVDKKERLVTSDRGASEIAYQRQLDAVNQDIQTVRSVVVSRRASTGGVDAARTEAAATLEQQVLHPNESNTLPSAANERANYRNQQENGNFSPEFNQGLQNTDRTYDPISNKETVAKANEAVKNLPAAEAHFLANEVLTPEHTATGYRLIQELDRAGQTERALNIANKLAADLTRSGQTTQAAAVLQRLSPEGRLLNLTRHAERNGKVVSTEDAQNYMALAREAQAAGLTGKRTSEVMDIFDRAKKGETLSPEDQQVVNELVQDVKNYVTSKGGKPPKEAKISPKMQEKQTRDKILAVLEEKEKAVLERIRKRGNRLASTPFDAYADYALLGSIKLAKGAVSFSKWSEHMIRDVGDEIKPHLSAIYEKSQRLLNTTSDKITETKVSNAEKVAEKFIKEGNISAKDEQVLRSLAKQLNELYTETGRSADMKMQQILNSYETVGLGGKISTLRYMSMLMNTSTQAVNAISGPLMMTYNHMLDIMATPIDLIYSAATKSPRSTTFKQGPGLFDHLLTPLVDWFKGNKVGAKAGWQGVDPEGIASQHDIKGLAFKSKLNPLGLAERTLGAVSKAPDYATYSATKNMELRKLAYLDAVNKGIKGKQNIRNYMDKFLANPDPKAVEQASRIGKKTTFQNTNGLAGKTATAARSLNALTGSKDLGVANAIVPFLRTPLNIAITGVENTPAGVLKGLFEINRLRNGAEDISKREIIKTLVSATAGGTLGLGGLGYVLSDLGIVTGDYSTTNKDVQSLQDSIGKGKFRFNSSAFGRMFDALLHGDGDRVREVSKYRPGDNQFDYNKLQPLAFPFAAGATFADQRSQAKAADKRGELYPLSKQVGESGKSALSSLFGMSSLQGLTSTFSTRSGSSGSEIPIQILQNIGESFMKGFSPSAMAQEARRQDPLQRQVTYNSTITEDLMSYYKSRLPKLSKTLPAKQNNLGDTKKNAPGVTGQYLNPLKSEKTQYNDAAEVVAGLITRTGNQKLAPTAMEKSVTGKNRLGESKTIRLSPARYAQLQEEVGKEIAAKILELPKYISDQELADRIENIYTYVRKRERDKVKREMLLK